MTEEDSHDDSKEIMGSTVSLETVGSEDLSELTESSQAESSGQQDDYVNPRGVRFTPQEPVKEGTYMYQGIGKSRTPSLEAFWSAVERRGIIYKVTTRGDRYVVYGNTLYKNISYLTIILGGRASSFQALKVEMVTLILNIRIIWAKCNTFKPVEKAM